MIGGSKHRNNRINKAEQDVDVPGEGQQWANDESYHDTTPDDTTFASSSESDPGSISTLTVANTQQDSDTECQQINDASNTTLIEPEVTTTLKEQCPLKDTPTKIDAIQSSSSEPNWGQYRQRTQQELEQEWQVWSKTNQNEQQGTTKAYRHYRCESCNKPASTTNLDTTHTLLCLECVPGRVTPEREDLVKTTKLFHKQGMEKTGRDDEEEWGGIPIPQSDDSDDEYWLDEISSVDSESERYETDAGPSALNSRNPDEDPDDASFNLTSQVHRTSTPPTKKGKAQMPMSNFDDLAFLIGPRCDGSIKRKDGTVLTLNDLITTLNPLPPTPEPSLEPIPTISPSQPNSIEILSWTGHLMRFQRSTLKMGYKRKSKLRSKLMKSIRKTVPTQVHVHWPPTQSRHIDVRPWHTFLTAASRVLPSISFDPLTEFGLVRFDPLTAFMPETSVTYLQRSPLQQCMNAIRSPNRTKTKLKEEIESTHKRKRCFSPITIPGTSPERRTQDNDFALHTTSETEEDDLNLYYSIYNRYRPDIDESNAESAARYLNIETEYRKLRKQPHKQHSVTNPDSYQSPHGPSITNQGTNDPSLDHHSLSPFQPISGSLTFHSSRTESPIIEPMDLTNNVQNIILTSAHSLYSNPDQPLPPQVIDLIYDTGAAISMMPAEYTYAWTNLCECLHTLTGCFAGTQESHLTMGEFHGIITLDSGETRRVIIPECVQVPLGIATTYLLADSAYLLAGHQYISHLSKPKLRFKGGGTYTMSVTKGHKIIHLLPTTADQETPHRVIYLHLDEPYDPPTYVNNMLFQCSNRPNVLTPSAFTWHLRYACKSLSVLQHTQQHVEDLHVRQGSFKDLKGLLPCTACLAGKMRKSKRPPTRQFTDIENLTTSLHNAPLSWTPFYRR